MRESQTKKISLTLVIGDKEVNENMVSYREFGKNDVITCSVEEFIDKVNDCIKNKKYNI